MEYINRDIFIKIFEAKFRENFTLHCTQMFQVISVEMIYFVSFNRTIYRHCLAK